MRLNGAKHNETRLLFITWDGPQTDYLEALYLPIFDRLADQGVVIDVLQYGWDDKERASRYGSLFTERKADFFHARVWRAGGLFGPLLTLFPSPWNFNRVLSTRTYDGVICRSVFAAMATLLHFRKYPMIYDSDGLALDERVDFGGWSAFSKRYRLLRMVENLAVLRAAVVLNRTKQANEVLIARAGPISRKKFFETPNGRDATVFRPLVDEERVKGRRGLGLSLAAPLLVHSGSVGPQYCPDLLLAFFGQVKSLEPGSKLLVLSKDPTCLKVCLQGYLELGKDVVFLSCTPNEVPTYLGLADLGVSFREDAFSMSGVDPLKTGEYLLCGLPVITYGRKGNLEKETPGDYGFHLQAADVDALRGAAKDFISKLDSLRATGSARRRLGIRLYSLETAAEQYGKALGFAVKQTQMKH